ncbi:MAG: hypothetical protein GY779_11625 [Gammaproteobacteria bacterium]|nr:hypothetical protein [Gammaproteobacteria bacterium]
MVQQVKGFAEHFAGFRRHLKIAAAVFSAIMIFGIGFSLSLPDIYRASSTVLIEEPEIPNEIIRSTVTTYTGRQLTVLNEKILTVSNLIGMIEEFDLYQDQRAKEPVEILAVNMRQNITVEVQSRDSVSSGGMPQTRIVGFSISFTDESPQVAKLIVDELTGKYLAENIKVRSEQTGQTSDFLKGEIVLLEKEIAALEGELAEFKEVNANRLPSLSALNMNMMNRMDQELRNIQRELNSIEENRISIVAQLATVDKSVGLRLPDGSYAMTPADQLKALQTQLAVYESRYSENHPDVISARRDISSIEERFGIDVVFSQKDASIATAKAELAIAEKKYASDHPDVIQLNKTIATLQRDRSEAARLQLEAQVFPDNPAYIGLQASLEKLDAEQSALKLQAKELNRRMADYELRLIETPQIEKQLAALSRELNSTSNRYWVLRDKQFAAEMGETLEVQSKGEEMTLLEPARLPLKPYKPNRTAIIMLAFLFALVAGVGVTQLADGLDKSIYGSSGIVAIQGVAPLVEIPYIYSEDDIGQTLKMRKMMLASLPILLLLTIVIVHFVLQPLDVLFYAVAARLGF